MSDPSTIPGTGDAGAPEPPRSGAGGSHRPGGPAKGAEPHPTGETGDPPLGEARGATRDATRGVLGGLAAVLREVLSTPRVGQAIRVLLANLDPERGEDLVRAALESDPALVLDLLASAPHLATSAAHGSRALAAHLAGLPAGLVGALAPNLLQSLSARPAGEAAAYALLFSSRVAGGDAARLRVQTDRLMGEFAAGFRAVLAREGLEAEALLGPLGAQLEAALSRCLDAAERAAPGPLGRLAEGAAARLRALPETHPELTRKVLSPLAHALWAALRTDSDTRPS